MEKPKKNEKYQLNLIAKSPEMMSSKSTLYDNLQSTPIMNKKQKVFSIKVFTF